MKVDSVPVDTCGNLTLVAAWETHKNHKEGNEDIKVGILSLLDRFLALVLFVALQGVQPHLGEHGAVEVGRDLRHGEGEPDEEPAGGDGLVPGGQLQTESCHQQVRTISLSHF